MQSKFKQFLCDESAATMVEYSILIGLIAMALMSTVTALATSLSGVFTRTATDLDGMNAS